MYVCPDCKAPLERNRCSVCKCEYDSVDGIPVLFSRQPRFERTREIARAYDSIYRAETNIWERVGRTEEFITYFSSLLNRFAPFRFLEIGCGEGFLLASVRSADKWAVDLSIEAIKAARTRTSAQFCVALVERLPFPADYFDTVTSVGVMEHFLDTNEALREVARVVKPGGHYVTLVHVKAPFLERVSFKISEYILPRPRPIAFFRWLRDRWLGDRQSRPRTRQAAPKQPIQNLYTRASGCAYLESNGFDVIDVIHTRRYPSLPLKGPFVVIYVAQKRSSKT